MAGEFGREDLFRRVVELSVEFIETIATFTSDGEFSAFDWIAGDKNRAESIRYRAQSAVDCQVFGVSVAELYGDNKRRRRRREE